MNGPYKEVRALARGLDVLTAVNQGIRAVAEIALATKLQRATVYRLLETLVGAGYLVRSDNDGSFRLTSQVRELSEGFRDEAWVVELAVPALRELIETVHWPSDIATFDGVRMIARESTHRFSALSIHRPIVGRRIAMVSALGQAYIAFAPDRERAKILATLRRSTAPEDLWWRKRAVVAAALARTRKLGYADVEGQIQDGIMAVAVPVLFRQRPLASVNVVVTRSGMPRADMATRFVGPLQLAARRIEEGLARGTVEAPRRTGL